MMTLTSPEPDWQQFLTVFARYQPGYYTGVYQAQRWSMSVSGDAQAKIRKLYAERLSGGDHVSFNLYTLANEQRLKPCEMPARKVMAFVLGFTPDSA